MTLYAPRVKGALVEGTYFPHLPTYFVACGMQVLMVGVTYG